MKIVFIHFLFSFLINFVQLKSKNNNIINANKTIHLNPYNDIRSFISDLKSDPDLILDRNFTNEKIKNFSEENNISFINPMIDDLLLNETSEFVNDFHDVIKNKINDTNVLDYILNILNLTEGKDSININDILLEINNFVVYPGMDKVFNYFKDYKDIIFTLNERIIDNTKVSTLYNDFRECFLEFRDQLIDYLYNFLRFYNDNDKLADITLELMKPGDYNFRLVFENYFDLPQFAELGKLIIFNNKIGEAIKNALFSEYVTTTFLFNFFDHKSLIEIYINIMKNWGDEKYLIDYLPEALRIIRDARDINEDFNTYLFYTIDTIIDTIKKTLNQEDYLNIITGNLMGKVENFFSKEGLLQKDFSPDCNYLLKSIYFSNYTYTTAFFLKKILIDSTKNKNDFLTYENCIEEKEFNETKDLNFTVKPAFVIGIIDDIGNKNKFKNSLLNEKYNYINSFCLPYGLYKEEKNGKKEMCSNKDYDSLMNITLQAFYDMSTATIKTINIIDNKFLIREYVYCILSLILIFLPLLIWIFLFLYKTIKIKNHEKEKKLIESQENSGSELKSGKLISKKFEFSNWYNYLQVFFNISKNAKELFNFSSNETNFNNLNGITYIKGILGISMVLYILGQIFLVLFNLPSKAISQSNFYYTIYNLLYAIILFSLRYCSRIIFSCSGYIFVYKFLCFIEQEQNNYLLKFLFRQSYKFILLFFIVLFMRYSLFYIDEIITQKKRPVMEIYRYNLTDNDEYFFERLFSFLIFNAGNNEFTKRQNLIQYFYLPLNEMFFFLFGIVFISFGYKFKFRIDYLIIIFGLSLYIIKIIYYIFSLHNKEYYSTLYFYLYDYGELMLNPIFNLPYYLIGMYFGLVNFSIQKGIVLHKYKANDSYALIEMFENSQEQESENSEKEKDLELNKINTQNNSTFKNVDESDELQDSYKALRKKAKKYKNKREENNINEQENNKNEDLDEKINEMPFLISPIKFLNFHRGYDKKNCLRILILLFVIFIIF